jgi:hypothetical protein
MESNAPAMSDPDHPGELVIAAADADTPKTHERTYKGNSGLFMKPVTLKSL